MRGRRGGGLRPRRLRGVVPRKHQSRDRKHHQRDPEDRQRVRLRREHQRVADRVHRGGAREHRRHHRSRPRRPLDAVRRNYERGPAEPRHARQESQGDSLAGHHIRLAPEQDVDERAQPEDGVGRADPHQGLVMRAVVRRRPLGLHHGGAGAHAVTAPAEGGSQGKQQPDPGLELQKALHRRPRPELLHGPARQDHDGHAAPEPGVRRPRELAVQPPAEEEVRELGDAEHQRHDGRGHPAGSDGEDHEQRAERATRARADAPERARPGPLAVIVPADCRPEAERNADDRVGEAHQPESVLRRVVKRVA